MDFTETNIKMCKKAWEIQALRKPYAMPFNEQYPDLFVDGDVLFIEGRIHIYANTSVVVNDWQDENGMQVSIGTQADARSHQIFEITWLPLQGQLQEMYGDFHECLAWIHDFQCPECNYFDGSMLRETSMEQLWLAFVMKKKYSKVWNGQEWVPQ